MHVSITAFHVCNGPASMTGRAFSPHPDRLQPASEATLGSQVVHQVVAVLEIRQG